MTYEQQESGTTPFIKFDTEVNAYQIEGRSLAENAMEFYGNAIQWIDEHLKGKKTKAVLAIKLDYCNTSSYLGIAQVLHKFKELNDAGSSFSVKWMYEEGDEDWLEDGQNFQEASDLPFVFEAFEPPPPELEE